MRPTPHAAGRLLPIQEWLAVACVNCAARAWFDDPALWQASFELSAWRGDAGANDVGQIPACALLALARAMRRIGSRRDVVDKLLVREFPALSPLRVEEHGQFWVLAQAGAP